MTRLPRDIDAETLIHALRKLGYRQTRQTGSHVRLTTLDHGEHHISIPRHGRLKVGTLNANVRQVCAHFGMTRNELLDLLFD